MKPFIRETAIAAPLDLDNIDTDQILPARFLMMPRDQRYKTYAFRDMKYDSDGNENPEFILNQAPWRNAAILVTGRNFGCGSSREGAVFTLAAAGFRAVIAPSFGDIFYNNSFNNGLLPVTLDEAVIDRLRAMLHDNPGAEITIDLESQRVTAPDGTSYPFEIDAHRKYRMLKGLDPIGYTLQFEAEIESFEQSYLQEMRWI